MSYSLMIDIEGLDVVSSSTILTIGAQLFDPFGMGLPAESDTSFYARIVLESQTNRTVDDNTLAWWGIQPQAAQDEAFAEDNRIELADALHSLTKITRKAKHVWCNGLNYDIPILDHAYRELGLPTPWMYNTVRDCRTIYSMVPDLDMPPTSHHALDDCWRQIALLQVCFEKLGVTQIR